MFAITGAYVPADRVGINPAKARRALAVLALVGLILFAMVADKQMGLREPERRGQCNAVWGQFAWGQCDWSPAILPSGK